MENAAPSNMQRWKARDWKRWHQMTWVEYTEVHNIGMFEQLFSAKWRSNANRPVLQDRNVCADYGQSRTELTIGLISHEYK